MRPTNEPEAWQRADPAARVSASSVSGLVSSSSASPRYFSALRRQVSPNSGRKPRLPRQSLQRRPTNRNPPTTARPDEVCRIPLANCPGYTNARDGRRGTHRVGKASHVRGKLVLLVERACAAGGTPAGRAKREELRLLRDPRVLVHGIVTSRDGAAGEYKVRAGRSSKIPWIGSAATRMRSRRGSAGRRSLGASTCFGSTSLM